MDSGLGMRLVLLLIYSTSSLLSCNSSSINISRLPLLGAKGTTSNLHNSRWESMTLHLMALAAAFGTSCCLWLNKEPLARRVDESVAVGGVGVTVCVLCECHLCVPQLSEEMWWRVWKRKAINKTLCPSTIPPLLSPFLPPSPFLLFLLTSFLPLFPFLSPPHSTSPAFSHFF